MRCARRPWASPTTPTRWFAYGTAAFNAGDTADGVTALDKAVRLDPNDAAKRLALTQALIRLGREKLGGAKQDAYAKAAESGKALVAKSPTYDNLLLLAEAELGAKDYSGAADALNKAAAKNSSRLAAQLLPGAGQHLARQVQRGGEQRPGRPLARRPARPTSDGSGARSASSTRSSRSSTRRSSPIATPTTRPAPSGWRRTSASPPRTSRSSSTTRRSSRSRRSARSSSRSSRVSPAVGAAAPTGGGGHR